MLLGLQVESISAGQACNYKDLRAAISQKDSQRLAFLIETCQKHSEHADQSFKREMTNLLTQQAIYQGDVAILDILVYAGADAKALPSSTIQDSIRIAEEKNELQLIAWIFDHYLAVQSHDDVGSAYMQDGESKDIYYRNCRKMQNDFTRSIKAAYDTGSIVQLPIYNQYSFMYPYVDLQQCTNHYIKKHSDIVHNFVETIASQKTYTDVLMSMIFYPAIKKPKNYNQQLYARNCQNYQEALNNAFERLQNNKEYSFHTGESACYITQPFTDSDMMRCQQDYKQNHPEIPEECYRDLGERYARKIDPNDGHITDLVIVKVVAPKPTVESVD